MELVFLAIVFAVIIVMLNIKPVIRGQKTRMPLNIAILTGILASVICYRISPARVGIRALETITSWDTLSLCLVTYMITFLQRMMERNDHLSQAHRSLSAIFNSRRVNATVAPILIGLLPSPAAAFIAGDMVKASCEGYLDDEEMTFVTSYYRHISESCLPTYSSIILALSLAGLSTAPFLLGMILPVLVLILLGYLFYVRKVPKETGLPKSEHPAQEWKKLFQSLWAIALIVALIIAFDLPVYVAVAIAMVLYFLVNRFKPREVAPYVKSSFEWNIMSNTVVVMFFKNILDESGVITLLPEAFAKLPLPLPIVFFLIFLVGSIIAGTSAIIAMCLPLAFATIPNAGMPLMILLMCGTYIAMQVSPVHVCLTLIAQYFRTSLGAIIKKTVPVMLCFIAFLIPYYYLLTLIPGY